MQTLYSALDSSVNFVSPEGREARYVRRVEDYFIAYISSHNGCNQACRMCHLTQTGQTIMDASTPDGMIKQVRKVFQHYAEQVESGREPAAKKVHFNWMARGEPLLNPSLMIDWTWIREQLLKLSEQAYLETSAFKVSTIMPSGMPKILDFDENPPELYYSLYSLNPLFRKRWLPKAMDPLQALDMLTAFTKTGGKVTLHWAMIEGENDSIEGAQEIVELIKTVGLEAKFNLVRYNPYSPNQGKEPDDVTLNNLFNILQGAMKRPGSKIVSRVGPDVAASCGMFIPKSMIPIKVLSS